MAEGRSRRGRGRPPKNGEGSPSRRKSGPTAARLIAVRVLDRVERVRAFADLALHHTLAQTHLASVDRALATELVYGTLRWRGRLDYILQQCLDRELSDLEPVVRATLRIGAYQLHFSDRIPATAAVDEAVRCARAVGAERATGLVNAVLRRVSKEQAQVRFPTLEEDPLAHLEHALSLPGWIAERWLNDYGPEAAAALAEVSNAPPPLAVRVNPLLSSRETLIAEVAEAFPEATNAQWARQGVILGRSGNAGIDPLFMSGHYTVQDEASQLVVELLEVRPGQRVLDVCAAPGTKTTGIAEALAGQGSVLALDRHAGRLKLIARAARRLGLSGISTLVRDSSQSLLDLPLAAGAPAPSDGVHFDRVLADVPCSGLGAMRRNADVRWRIRAQDPSELAQTQSEILAQAAQVVSPGGTLVYSTCTVMREENEEVIQPFLKAHPHFKLVPKADLPPHLHSLIDSDGFLRCFPHKHDTDGFFAARLEKVRAS
ncbi:MAG: 16S rRNA (cytosine(967)-C(5))-methyltransferase [Deltaproteobacteria bacterium]|nr:16S rRNA (cytosine(967)-C(5))-methyltransferase [Deltaproteobacteria bacterium]